MRDFLIAGNWKMNGSSAANAELVAGIVAGVPAGSGFSLLVCPPFPYLASVAEQVKGSPVKLIRLALSTFSIHIDSQPWITVRITVSPDSSERDLICGKAISVNRIFA